MYLKMYLCSAYLMMIYSSKTIICRISTRNLLSQNRYLFFVAITEVPMISTNSQLCEFCQGGLGQTQSMTAAEYQ